MTDRCKGFYVALTHDIREDDIEPLIQAVRMLRGVQSVETSITSPGDWMNREQVRAEFRDKIRAFLRDLG